MNGASEYLRTWAAVLALRESRFADAALSSAKAFDCREQRDCLSGAVPQTVIVVFLRNSADSE